MKSPAPLNVRFRAVHRLGRPKHLPFKKAIYTVLMEDGQKVSVVTSINASVYDIKRIAEMKLWIEAKDVIQEDII